MKDLETSSIFNMIHQKSKHVDSLFSGLAYVSHGISLRREFMVQFHVIILLIIPVNWESGMMEIIKNKKTE